MTSDHPDKMAGFTLTKHTPATAPLSPACNRRPARTRDTMKRLACGYVGHVTRETLDVSGVRRKGCSYVSGPVPQSKFAV
jgi:hypothetical protein